LEVTAKSDVNNFAGRFFERTLPDTALALLPTAPLLSLPNLFGLQATLRGAAALLIPGVLINLAGIDAAPQSTILLARLSSFVMVLLGGRLSHADSDEVARIGFFWFSGWTSILGYALYSNVASGPVSTAFLALHASMAVLAFAKATDLGWGTLKRDLSVEKDELFANAKKMNGANEPNTFSERSETALNTVGEVIANSTNALKTEIASTSNKASDKIKESGQRLKKEFNTDKENTLGPSVLRAALVLQSYLFFLGAWFFPEYIVTLFQVPIESSAASWIFTKGLALNSILFGFMMDRCSDRDVAISGTWYFSGMALFSVFHSAVGSMGPMLMAFFTSQALMTVWCLVSATRSSPEISTIATNIRRKYVPPVP
jgi:hypothetical protein